jgi:hypothetical protein
MKVSILIYTKQTKTMCYSTLMAWVKGCLGMTLFLSLSPGSSTAQNASEMLSAALRLKQAYVIRSYNQCIDFGKTTASA